MALICEHFDTILSFTHEPYPLDHPAYFKQLPLFDCTMAHPAQFGRLLPNLFGTSQACFIYFDALATFLITPSYQSSSHDPCILYKHDSTISILISISIDDLLVVSSNTTLMASFHTDMYKEYILKNCKIQPPSLFGLWRVTKTDLSM